MRQWYAVRRAECQVDAMLSQSLTLVTGRNVFA
jgi:hypothetical protein